MALKNERAINLSSAGRTVAVILMLLALLIWGIVLNINIGSVDIPASKVFSMIWQTVCGTAESASVEHRIVFTIRIPRVLLAALLGGGLAVSGFLLQAFFRNPIAGPFVLGISSGAKMLVGVALIALPGYIQAAGSGALVIAAFAGSLVITAIVLLLSGKVKSMSMLLVIGIMIGYICSAVTDFLITFANELDIVNLTSWSMGSFSGADGADVKLAALLCLGGTLIAWLMSKPMGAYALGEGYAKSLGINIKLFRAALILLSSLLSACVTALAGPVSFVGIAVPHITRTLIKTSKPEHVIPTCFVCGATFCVFCDLISRCVFAPVELAIGTVTSVFGAPIVIYIMVKRRNGQEG